MNMSGEASGVEEEAFRIQVRLLPDDVSLRVRFARFLSERRRFPEAAAELRAALDRRPDDLVLMNALANSLLSARRPAEAASLLRQGLTLEPAEPALHVNLGLALTDLARFPEAETSFERALRLTPLNTQAMNNLASLYIMMGRHREAIALLERALVVDPEYAAARRNRGLAHLCLGEFEAGWNDYDWVAHGLPQPATSVPGWNDESLAGRRLLLTAQQGLGDTLQFIRYAPMLRALAEPPKQIVLECQEPLLEVLADVEGVDVVAPFGRAPPPTDLSAPLMGLPRFFRTTVATIPARHSYLAPAPARVERWRDYLAAHTQPGQLRVGIYWQGNRHHQWDQFRSMPLRQYEMLARIPRARLISLQRGPGLEQIADFQEATSGALLIPTDGRQESPQDLAESAALMSLLDVVVTVDTATAHLAGAIGARAFVALSLATDWRWLTERADTPWYPTMRLFRQTTINDWPPVVKRIAAALQSLPRRF